MFILSTDDDVDDEHTSLCRIQQQLAEASQRKQKRNQLPKDYSNKSSCEIIYIIQQSRHHISDILSLSQKLKTEKSKSVVSQFTQINCKVVQLQIGGKVAYFIPASLAVHI